MDASKAKLERLQGELKLLNDKLDEEKDKITATLTTNVSRVASMPLMGATVIDMAESHVNGEYQIAVAMKWDKKNGKFARAILPGQALKDDPAPGRSLADWLGKIDRGTMLGSRVFTDENGDRSYIGVGSYPTGGGGPRLVRAKLNASLSADRNLMFALIANAEAHQNAITKLEMASSDGPEDDQSYANSAAMLASASIGKTTVPNKRILIDEPAINPVTGQEVWVQVIAVNATSSQKALDELRERVSKVIDITRYQADAQGRLQGMSDAQKDAVGQAKAIRIEAAAKIRQELLASRARAASPRPDCQVGRDHGRKQRSRAQTRWYGDRRRL